MKLIKAGKAQALVTAPVSKESIALHQKGFVGHTEFLARSVGLYNVESNFEFRMTISDYLNSELDDHNTLAEFQQMSIAAKFEDCLVAYYGKELTQEQKDALKVIHSSTAPWMLGHVAGQLTEKMNSSNDKDFVDACEMIVDLLKEDGDKTKANSKKLIIKVK